MFFVSSDEKSNCAIPHLKLRGIALKNLEIYRSDRVAFILIYAANESSYNRQIELLKQKSTLAIKDISYEKKLTILRKLNNMNMDIKVG